MNCLRCNTPNEEGAKFCKNCGMDMSYTPSKDYTNSNQTINQLLILLGLSYFFKILYLILNFVVRFFGWGGYEINEFIGWATNIISILTFLVFAIITKHKNTRVFLIIFLLIEITQLVVSRILYKI